MTTTESIEVSAETAELRFVAPDVLVPNPLNPRRDVVGDGEKARKRFDQLVDSIKQVGVLEPLLAFERDHIDGTLGTELVLLAGHRRQAGAIKAHTDTVPVLVRPEPSTFEQRMMMLIENGHRNDLTPIEEARAYDALVEEGVAQKDIATRLGRSEGHVSKRLAIVQKLPAEVLERFDAGDLSIEGAYALSRIADDLDLVVRLGRERMLDERQLLRDVQTELTRREQAKAYAATVAELEAAGTPIASATDLLTSQIAGLCGNVAESASRGTGSITWLAIDVDDHAQASAACHAAIVNPAGEVFWVCVDPDRHDVARIRQWGWTVPTIAEIVEANTPNEDGDVAPEAFKPRVVDPETRARFEAAQARAEERRDFYISVLARSAEDIADVALWPLAVTSAWSVLDTNEVVPESARAAQYIGLVLDDLDWSAEEEAWIAAIGSDPTRVALAAALSGLEPLLFRFSLATASVWDGDHYGTKYTDPATGASLTGCFLEWLESAGFAVGDIERNELTAWMVKLAEQAEQAERAGANGDEVSEA